MPQGLAGPVITSPLLIISTIPGIAANGQEFDGTDDYFNLSLGTTLGSDSKFGTFSWWVKHDGTGSTESYWVISGFGGAKARLYKDSSGNLLVDIRDVGGTAYSFTMANSGKLDDGTWRQVIVFVNTTQSTASNRVKAYYRSKGSSWTLITWTGTPTYPAQDTILDWTANVGAVQESSIGAIPFGASWIQDLDGCMYQFYANFTDDLDVTDSAQRDAFGNGAGALWLGADGSVPGGGGTPDVYFADMDATDNDGSGPNYTAQGNLTTTCTGPGE